MLAHIYERWYALSNVVEAHRSRYLELKLEDFGTDPHGIMKQISDFCGVRNAYAKLDTVSMGRVDYWEKKITAETMLMLNELLGHHVTKMGYRV